MGLSCGTRIHPWLLEAPAGQRINVSLVDFTTGPLTTSAADDGLHTSQVDSRRNGCSSQSQAIQYGYIIDKSTSAASKRNVSVCGGVGFQRLFNVYLSSGSTVELVLFNSDVPSPATSSYNDNFLVRIEGT